MSLTTNGPISSYARRTISDLVVSIDIRNGNAPPAAAEPPAAPTEVLPPAAAEPPAKQLPSAATPSATKLPAVASPPATEPPPAAKPPTTQLPSAATEPPATPTEDLPPAATTSATKLPSATPSSATKLPAASPPAKQLPAAAKPPAAKPPPPLAISSSAGCSRAHSSSSDTKAAPGRVDTAPMSIYAAPASAKARKRSINPSCLTLLGS